MIKKVFSMFIVVCLSLLAFSAGAPAKNMNTKSNQMQIVKSSPENTENKLVEISAVIKSVKDGDMMKKNVVIESKDGTFEITISAMDEKEIGTLKTGSKIKISGYFIVYSNKKYLTPVVIEYNNKKINTVENQKKMDEMKQKCMNDMNKDSMKITPDASQMQMEQNQKHNH